MEVEGGGGQWWKGGKKDLFAQSGLGKADGVPSRGLVGRVGDLTFRPRSPRESGPGHQKKEAQNRNGQKQGWTYQKRLELQEEWKFEDMGFDSPKEDWE